MNLWNALALLLLLCMMGLLTWTEFSISKESNAAVCTQTPSAADQKKKLVFVDADKAGSQAVRLHGHFCLALNVNNYFGASKPDALQDKAFALFLNGYNTGLKTSGTTRADSEGWLWLNWNVDPQLSDATIAPATVWQKIIGQPNFFTGHASATVGVGDDTAQTPHETVAAPAFLDLYDPPMAWIGEAILVLLGISVFMGNRNTGLFRDGSGWTSDAPNAPQSAYSLSKAQLAVWMLLTTGGFLFIWATTGRTSGVITPDIFSLMGIQMGTGLAAVYVDQNAKPSQSTGSFFADILCSDGRSPALPRLQMFVWTLILGGIFIWSLFSKLSFPALDSNLLVLIGFVNGNYVGFKFPENKQGAPAAPGG